MNFNEFINDCRTQWPDFDSSQKLSESKHPHNRFLATLLNEIPGMATENKLMLLNLAVRHLDRGEVYVEIGCWQGLSLAGGAKNNPMAKIYACDNFSQFGGPKDQLQRTIHNYLAPGQANFYLWILSSF